MYSHRQLILTQAITALVTVVAVLAFLLLAAPGRLSADGAHAPQGSLLTGFINKTPAELFSDTGANYSVGGGPNISGVQMPGTGFSRVITGFTLPP
jgi:hypothetical protein